MVHQHEGDRNMATEPVVNKPLDTATLGGGCFWCLEAVFEQLIGVEKVESGYAGGHVEQPTYKQVCTATTGHAEVVRVTFDPSIITYRELLEVFFAIHDPTTLNRQGADVGPQYRSVIFTHDDGQREVATRLIAELAESQAWPRPIVTEVAPAPRFHKAEEYHQGYFRGNAYEGYCQAVVAPKVLKSREKFARLMR
jgi:peptide-methionine (S)-S-oxide reductase